MLLRSPIDSGIGPGTCRFGKQKIGVFDIFIRQPGYRQKIFDNNKFHPDPERGSYSRSSVPFIFHPSQKHKKTRRVPLAGTFTLSAGTSEAFTTSPTKLSRFMIISRDIPNVLRTLGVPTHVRDMKTILQCRIFVVETDSPVSSLPLRLSHAKLVSEPISWGMKPA